MGDVVDLEGRKKAMEGTKAKGPCGAKTRTGGTCRKPAGWGTNHLGAGRCKHHGGSTPNGEKHGAREMLRQEAIVMGAPLDIEPHEALMTCIRIAAGELQYASEQVAALKSPTVSTMFGPALDMWVMVRQRAMDRLAQYAKLALAAGIAERQVRVAEQQGELIVRVINGALSDLGVEPGSEEARNAVRRHLELVSGAA